MQSERAPTADEQAGMDWWNTLSVALREQWVAGTNGASAADAWQAYKYADAPVALMIRTQGEVARRFREKWGYVGKGGVVVFHNGEVQGWVNELRDPKSWVSGCVAIDESDRRWQTVAGDAYNGALLWIRIDVNS